jgi:hypothetical protein
LPATTSSIAPAWRREVDQLERDAQLVAADRDHDLTVGMQRAGAARVEHSARRPLRRGGEVARHRRDADQLRHAGNSETGLPSNAAAVAGAQLRPHGSDDAGVDGGQAVSVTARGRTASPRHRCLRSPGSLHRRETSSERAPAVPAGHRRTGARFCFLANDIDTGARRTAERAGRPSKART